MSNKKKQNKKIFCISAALAQKGKWLLLLTFLKLSHTDPSQQVILTVKPYVDFNNQRLNNTSYKHSNRIHVCV